MKKESWGKQTFLPPNEVRSQMPRNPPIGKQRMNRDGLQAAADQSMMQVKREMRALIVYPTDWVYDGGTEEVGPKSDCECRSGPRIKREREIFSFTTAGGVKPTIRCRRNLTRALARVASEQNSAKYNRYSSLETKIFIYFSVWTPNSELCWIIYKIKFS